MVELHKRLEGGGQRVHDGSRGAGRSTLLDCVAAEISTTDSRWGRGIALSEIPACAKDLRMKFGDLASFSTTSAATGVSTFISNFSNRASSIIYGVSYGTVMVERLMHLTRKTLMDTFWTAL
ncbi:hypothetical protein PI124_g5342 [Phytophthora idaei]|nr:hypothetical protein PI126_g10007 [Phytophthora idaei]KAG3250003.1 hypothetical protein PI124_g5342 [Phytophthora idaei]